MASEATSPRPATAARGALAAGLLVLIAAASMWVGPRPEPRRGGALRPEIEEVPEPARPALGEAAGAGDWDRLRVLLAEVPAARRDARWERLRRQAEGLGRLTVTGPSGWRARVDDGPWVAVPGALTVSLGARRVAFAGPQGRRLDWRLVVDRSRLERTVELPDDPELGRRWDLIPAGPVRWPAALPQPVALVPFVASAMLARAPVNNGEYARYLAGLSPAERARARPSSEDWVDGRLLSGRENEPVWGVPPAAALAYARAHGARLPSAGEWLRARLGDAPPADRAVACAFGAADAGVAELVVSASARLFGGPGRVLVAGRRDEQPGWLHDPAALRARGRGAIRLARSFLGSLDPAATCRVADPGLRMAAWQRLGAGSEGDPERGERLLPALADDDAQLRGWARALLREDTLAVTRLATRAGADGSPTLRREVAWLVARTGSRAAALAVLADPDARIARAAAAGLLDRPGRWRDLRAADGADAADVPPALDAAALADGDAAAVARVVARLLGPPEAALDWCQAIAGLLPERAPVLVRRVLRRTHSVALETACAQLGPALDQRAMAALSAARADRTTRWAEVIGPLALAQELAPDAPQIPFHLGYAYLSARRHARSAQATRRAIELAPSSVAWTNLAAARFWAGRWTEARAHAERALALAGPGRARPNPRFLRGAAAAMTGRVVTPVRMFCAVSRIAADPTRGVAHGPTYSAARMRLFRKRFPRHPSTPSVNALEAILSGRLPQAARELTSARGALADLLRAAVATPPADGDWAAHLERAVAGLPQD